MPCYDHRSSPSYINEHTVKPLKERVDLYASWLCHLLRRIPAEKIHELPLDLSIWWREHQDFDAKRGQHE